MDETERTALTNELERPVVAIIQLVARWLGADEGRTRLEFEFDDGKLRRTFRHTGPIGHTELAALAESNA